MNEYTKKQSRQCRFFISSTFEDLQEERSRLARRVFPALRGTFAGSGISLVDVDLRWGITDEQSRLEGTLNLCLAEIETCVPYYIILLGGRYGWRPQIDAGIEARFPWIAEHRNKSITELEIVALLDRTEKTQAPGSPPSIFCYLKTLPNDGAIADPEVLRLRDELKRHPAVTIRSFSTPEELEIEATADLTVVLNQLAEQNRINRLVPDIVSCYRRVNSRQGARTRLFGQMIAVVEGRGHLILHGAEGAGKTTLAHEYVQSLLSAGYSLPRAFTSADPPAKAKVVFPLFVQDSNYRGDVRFLLHAILDALSTSAQEKVSVTAKPQAFGILASDIVDRLAAIEAESIVLVVDGFDAYISRFVDEKYEQFVRALPTGASLVVTLRSDNIEKLALSTRRSIREIVNFVEITELPDATVLEQIGRVLALYGKTLDQRHLAALTGCSMRGNLSFLSEVSEEIRTRSTFATLDANLERLCAATNLGELYGLLLSSRVNEVTPPQSAALRAALGFLALSSPGLTEQDLKGVVLTLYPSLSSMDWSAISLSLANFVIVHDGRWLPRDESMRSLFERSAVEAHTREALVERLSQFLLHEVGQPWASCEAMRLLRASGARDALDQCSMNPALMISVAECNWTTFVATFEFILADRHYWELPVYQRRPELTANPAYVALLACAMEHLGRAMPRKQEDLALLLVVDLEKNPNSAEDKRPDVLTIFEGTMHGDAADIAEVRRVVRWNRIGFRTILHLVILKTNYDAVVLQRRGGGVVAILSEDYRSDPAVPLGGVYRVFYVGTGDGKCVDSAFSEEKMPVVKQFWTIATLIEKSMSTAVDAMDMARLRECKPAYLNWLETGVSIGALTFDLDFASQAMKKQAEYEYGNLGRIMEFVRKCKAFQRAASNLGDEEAYCRFVLLQGRAVLHSGHPILIEEACRTIGLVIDTDESEDTIRLAALRNAHDALVAAAEQSAGDTQFEPPDRRDWTIGDLTAAVAFLQPSGRAAQIDWAAVQSIFEFDANDLKREAQKSATEMNRPSRQGWSVDEWQKDGLPCFLIGGCDKALAFGPRGFPRDAIFLKKLLWFLAAGVHWGWIVVSRGFCLLVALGLFMAQLSR